MTKSRLLIKIEKNLLTPVKDRYPFIYLEHGRLEVDDSSVRWLSAEGTIVAIPVATIQCLLLGPGTSVTHEAIKVLAQANCLAAWVGEDSLLFYAAGCSPTANTKNLVKQVALSAAPDKRVTVARKLFKYRFPDVDISDKSIPELMGMEGNRVRQLYEEMALQYQVGWTGRSFEPGKFQMSDITNRCLTALNAALYGVVNSCIHSLGLSPRIGFIHSGSPLPFVYDIADLYKKDLTIELAFKMTKQMGGVYMRDQLRNAFVEKAVEMRLLEMIPKDINQILGFKNAARNS